MTKQKKPFGCPHTQTAQQNICNYNFTQFITKLKATRFNVSAWLKVVLGGSLC
jgi:hypothetical protein